MGSVKMRRLSLACLVAALSTGCASLQIDVDVYKGPLVQERHIQVRQFAAMAASAKPLIRDRYEEIKAGEDTADCGIKRVEDDRMPREPRARFLCEILQLYANRGPRNEEVAAVGQSQATKGLDRSTQSQRPTSRNPEQGLDDLTFLVTQAMARTTGGADTDREVEVAVDRLSEALILFAQKLVYLANNELLYKDRSPHRNGSSTSAAAPGEPLHYPEPQAARDTTEDDQWEKTLSVLQSLGNTILVHANDLRRQIARDELHADSAASVSNAVQQAFQPEPSAAIDAILFRLQHFSLSDTNDPDEEVLDTATAEQSALREQRQNELNAYLTDIAPLLAAYRTVIKDPHPVLVDKRADAEPAGSLTNDRYAIAALYGESQARAADGLKPLNDWLSRETAQGVVTSLARPARLEAFKTYLFAEKARLEAAGITDGSSRASAMTAFKGYLEREIAEAFDEANKKAAKIDAILQTINAQNNREADRLRALAKKAAAAELKTMRETMVAAVRGERVEVIREAESLGTRDPGIINSILLRRLNAARQSGDAQKNNGIALTVGVLEKFTIPKTPCHVSVYSAQCRGKTAIEVQDNLIAALRAQRVQAIASGNEVAANNLLKAVNAAYEQRTAMIYLRPASDYLRSVYASTTLQDGAEDQYRNMLAGWLKNLRGNVGRSEASREKLESRRELEKINWQNVNKVTVSGGGFTNYVIAKDDVGNWYVKAYGSDPEAIIKSATSLALFNTGKGVDVNLLRRVEAQRRLDEDKSLSDTERAELRKEVGPANPQSGQALLKVRDRYAARYSQDTFTQAAALLAAMKEIPAKAGTRVAGVTTWPAGETCTPAKASALLVPLEARHLAPARDRLAATVEEAAKAAKPGTALLEQAEKNIQAGLTAMHLYGSDVPRTLKQNAGPECDAAEQAAARLVRDDLRAQVVAVATARRASIERYEDALTGVLDIASEQ